MQFSPTKEIHQKTYQSSNDSTICFGKLGHKTSGTPFGEQKLCILCKPTISTNLERICMHALLESELMGMYSLVENMQSFSAYVPSHKDQFGKLIKAGHGGIVFPFISSLDSIESTSCNYIWIYYNHIINIEQKQSQICSHILNNLIFIIDTIKKSRCIHFFIIYL